MLSVRLTPDKPGCSAAAAVDGKVVWTGARGITDIATGTPISAGTVFDIASVSKQFTATAVLLLAGEGRLSIEDTLAERLPGMPAWAGQVTIAQLMHHTSGIPDYIPLLVMRGYPVEKRATQADGMRTVVGVPRLGFRPGTRFEYSNSNYMLLAAVVHRVSGTPLPQFLERRVFDPLGLSMAMAPVAKIEGKAKSYGGLDLRIADSPWEVIGDGGVQSTPSDLVRWADNYRTGKVGGPGLLTAQLAAPVETDFGPDRSYAAGIVMAKDGALGHEGGWAGFRTSFQISPDRHTAVAVACNAANHQPAPMADELRRIWS
jgi:CubicO group peptidase (beta-lactamase class C family)